MFATAKTNGFFDAFFNRLPYPINCVQIDRGRNEKSRFDLKINCIKIILNGNLFIESPWSIDIDGTEVANMAISA
jgi:hypothetical protein